MTNRSYCLLYFLFVKSWAIFAAICCGDHASASLVATASRSAGCVAKRQRFGRRSACAVRYRRRPPWRRTSPTHRRLGRALGPGWICRRDDPGLLGDNPSSPPRRSDQAQTLFADLQRRQPGRFQDGQLRTLQRRVKRWRALAGRPKEVFFEQRYEPGALGQSDFTYMTALEIRIQGQPFDHLLYHFVLPYSNWEWGTVCFTESFESLSAGLQTALWKLGGAPHAHRTDRLSAAVHQEIHPEVFTRRYQALLAHYRMDGRRIQASQPHENGDIEQPGPRLRRRGTRCPGRNRSSCRSGRYSSPAGRQS